ncbi:PAS domain-containing protein [Sphingomonas sinipercae]|uniref:histidine kinase n=1 Tax=Sphingomonas sinipercae TaxID=2714944 RepID=A0A6G7ZPC1_9SPHN|nr:HWE histidine kinase domain-containing protein [Sphingomonas sinipercae]QIL02769.1 PAS domain-containing protein [Sphingomonas sinipercae]
MNTSDSAIKERVVDRHAACLASQDCVKILDGSGTIQFFNEEGLAIMEIDDLAMVHGRYWPELWPEESRELLESALDGARSNGVVTLVADCPTAKGTDKTWEVTVASIPAPSGHYCVISRDITDRQAREQQKTLLMQELSHRMKNSFSMVQAIAEQTFQSAAGDSLRTFHARLAALGSANNLLLQSSWSATPMRGLVERVLRVEAEPDQFDLSGPDISVAPDAALSMSLLLHEMATNAVKYGALSTPAGKVRVEWQVEGSHFVLHWKETDGPAVEAPETTGFGSRLIGLGICNSRDVSIAFDPAGVQARFRAPLADVRDS